MHLILKIQELQQITTSGKSLSEKKIKRKINQAYSYILQVSLCVCSPFFIRTCYSPIVLQRTIYHCSEVLQFARRGKTCLKYQAALSWPDNKGFQRPCDKAGNCCWIQYSHDLRECARLSQRTSVPLFRNKKHPRSTQKDNE